MTAPIPTLNDVRKFWFEEAGPAKWYAVSPAFDARLRRRFAAFVESEAARLKSGDQAGLDTPEDALALIVLLDQFPRNIWRGSGKAFDFDAQSLAISKHMIERGFDWAIADNHRAFVYMPFMHSERIEDQDLCVLYAEERLEGDSTHTHAIKHREVIERFGRFPYRNEALGRDTTPEERDYLTSGGYAPGSKQQA